MRHAQQRDEDVRTIVREATRKGASGVTIACLCWDWPLSLRRVLDATRTALVRGWLVESARGVYRVPE